MDFVGSELNTGGSNASLVPRPFRRRKGLVHIASACAGGPQKKLGESDTIVYSPFIVHRTARHAKSVSDHHGNATGHYGDASACACNVYQALLSPPEGPGYEASQTPVPGKTISYRARGKRAPYAGNVDK